MCVLGVGMGRAEIKKGEGKTVITRSEEGKDKRRGGEAGEC